MNAANLRRELAACGALVRHVYYSRVNQGSNALTWLLLGTALLAPVILILMTGQWARSIGRGAGMPLAVLALMWWMLLAFSITDQNRHTARLVPRIGQRSVAVLMACWFIVVLVLTPLATLAGQDPLTSATAVGLIMVFVAVITIVPAMVWLMTPFLLGPLLFGERWKALMSMVAGDVTPWMSLAVTIALGYFVLRKLARGLPQKVALAILVTRAGGAQLVAPAAASYVGMLLRDCAHDRPAALQMHAIGPAVRVPSIKWFVIALVAAIAVMFAAPDWIDKYRGLLHLAVPAMLVGVQVIIASTMLRAVYAARGEQALVRLAPRAPGTAVFNGTLARSLLLEYGRWWGSLTVLALALSFMLDAKGGALLRIVCVSLIMLAPAALLLRDYSITRDRNPVVRLGMIVGMFGIGFLMLFAAGGVVDARIWLALVTLLLAAALAFGRIRWNAMLRAPVAFPAGRGS